MPPIECDHSLVDLVYEPSTSYFAWIYSLTDASVQQFLKLIQELLVRPMRPCVRVSSSNDVFSAL